MKRPIIAGLALLAFSASHSRAADIDALCPAAMKSVMTEIIPRFEKSAAEKDTVEYGTVGWIIGHLKAARRPMSPSSPTSSFPI